ncbi:MAG: hypothetical protein EA376_02945 [Phycisphaeraceae bacterium]|nr:MAG: hypothetical protein EA376_02945 [Phycisphaeraceae bacterium]
MKADPISFKRAVSVSLLGLAIQIVLGLTMLVYGVFGQDQTAILAFFYSLIGLPVWLGLALVYHQHKLERLEAQEAELYATSSAAQATVFQEVDDELRVAARRLKWMHRILMPVLSLVVGGLLVGLGLYWFNVGRAELAPGAFDMPQMTGWAVSLGLVVAVIGFIFARFVAGMSKQSIWANLRAGASYVVGAAFIGLAIALGHGAAFAGTEAVLKYLHVLIPIFFMILGAEVFLNFLLNIYRPRRAGEIPRPAFDSRLLGFIAAPDKFVESISDAINYQFGFDVSSTWFYQLISRSFMALILLGGLIIWGLTSFAIVEPNQRALVLSFGKLQREVGSGLVIKAPWPFQTLETHPALAVTQIDAATPPPSPDEDILWTTPHHAGDERLLLVQSSPATGETRAHDLSVLAVETPVLYAVTDLTAYRMLAADSENPRDPDALRRTILQMVASRVVIEYVATMSIDEILGPRRVEMGPALQRMITERFNALGAIDPQTGQPRGAGVEVLFVGVAGAHPPEREEVARNFESVVASEQRGKAIVETSHATAIRTLARVAGDVDLARRIVDEIDRLEELENQGADRREIVEQELRIEALMETAGGEAASKIQQARADRWERQMSARVMHTRQAGREALYNASPAFYTAHLYLDALRNATRDARLFITTFDHPRMRFNFEEAQATFAGFEAQTAQE